MNPVEAVASPWRIVHCTDKPVGPEALVELNGITVTLGGTPVLRDINLSMRKGDIYELLGPDGAGKTTTIWVIAGLSVIEHCSMRVVGLSPTTDRIRLHARIGVLPEQTGFYDCG